MELLLATQFVQAAIGGAVLTYLLGGGVGLAVIVFIALKLLGD